MTSKSFGVIFSYLKFPPILLMSFKANKAAVLSIFISLFAQMQAISLLGIAIPINLMNQGIDVSHIGLIMAFYSVGLIIGCIQGKKFINQVGHIRAFAGFASLSAIIAILHNLTEYFILSAAFRLLSGASAAVLIVVLESWCLAIAKKSNNRKLIATYQMVFYLAMGSGLLLINVIPMDLKSAYLLAALLFCVALLPMTLVRIKDPIIVVGQAMGLRHLCKLSPCGVIGAIAAGSAIGSIYNLAPVYAKELGNSTLDTTLFMSSIVFSGVFLQHMIEKLSRHIDRTKVLASVLTVLCVFTYVFIIHVQTLPLLILGIFLGSFIACIYPLSLNITADKVDENSAIAASSTMLLFYAIGGFSGPVLSSSAMNLFGVDSLFYYLGLSSLLAVVLILLIRKRAVNVS